ncbi:AsmA-like C-terminal region-containing protein [Variovorax sp. J22P240]|uniref:AsmA-like C-terminal region-containing protein n=1 Tax=Variovorax sp. J22P240 TaxID=3053514 RepID=UPI002575AB6A|nr:AsmA-like C-terminal region-containing protein [Variovorax sp. J22P240]MDL9999266.1 AsmA-like C-terminal region-containing protein [Variovorax sp. J22P240]
MTRARRWFAGSLAAAALLLAGLALLIHSKLPSDEELAADLGARFESASGIALRVGAAHWALMPSPVVVLEDLSTAQPRPITVRRIVVRPHLSALWTRKIAIDAIEIDGAVLPRTSVRAFRGRWQADDAAIVVAGAWTLAAIPVERVRLRDVVWIDRRDIALAYDADILFDPHWRPREAQLSRSGVTPPANLRVEREGEQDRWRTLIDVGGGTWNGHAALQELDKGRLRLTAQLEPKDVDVGALVRSFGRHSAVEGKLQGQTAVDTEGENVTEMIRTLHTRTRFNIAPANLTGFDLAKMVSTGSGRGGQTRLDTLAGTLDTQATEEGVILRYSGMKARSGALIASGSATVINRRLDGEAAVDIVDGVVGVPLKLGGTLDAPQVALTGAALTGAAVGTAVLPGVGTAIGARVGQELDKLLGNEEAKKKPR